MKSRTLSILFLVLCIAFALIYGAQQGWQKDYAAVEEVLSSLDQHLNTRVETACNILTVALRHTDRDDASVASLTQIRDTLRSDASLADKARANEQMTLEAENLLKRLASLESVQDDDRDSMYVNSMLPRMLSESAAYAAQSEYNTAARDFNARFSKNTISSFIAAQFGVAPFELFGAAE
ncbi:MAG: hypothetical protein IKT57_05760 [Clostridia bacterium]|nr:hypothetical protein [Clostridia bacterium]